MNRYVYPACIRYELYFVRIKCTHVSTKARQRRVKIGMFARSYSYTCWKMYIYKFPFFLLEFVIY